MGWSSNSSGGIERHSDFLGRAKPWGVEYVGEDYSTDGVKGTVHTDVRMLRVRHGGQKVTAKMKRQIRICECGNTCWACMVIMP
jgi:hypothetical protein